MIMKVFYFVLATILFIVDAVKFCYKLTKIGFSWATIVTVLTIIILSRYFRLRRPPPSVIEQILGNSAINLSTNNDNTHEWWPIANRGACLDALENSKSAIEKCIDQHCKNVLLDVEMTKCDELIILHRQTLKRIESNISTTTTTDIQSISFEDLKSINIAKNHPLCEKHSPESILSFDELMRLLAQTKQLNLFLFVASTNKRAVQQLTTYFEEDSSRLNRLVIVSRSPLFIYLIRKRNPNLVCALWLDDTSKLRLPTFVLHSPLFTFAYGILFRHLVACVTGISAIFISKHDFNVHTAQSWQRAGIRSIVYTLNSPSEKRYFQQTIGTQYLTDSLRSEPHNFIKGNK